MSRSGAVEIRFVRYARNLSRSAKSIGTTWYQWNAITRNVLSLKVIKSLGRNDMAWQKNFFGKLKPEEASQIAVVKYLSLQYPGILWCHPPQETYTESRFQKWKNKMMGVKRGVPDLLIFEPRGFNFGLAIEMKYGRNKPTKDQQDWLIALGNRGWRTHVCRSSADAIDIIDDYLGKKK